MGQYATRWGSMLSSVRLSHNIPPILVESDEVGKGGHRLKPPVAGTTGIAYDTKMAVRLTVVLDSSVLEAAMRSRRGASFAVLSQVGSGRFEVAVSVPLVLEYEEVLTRQAGDVGRSPAEVQDVIDYLCAVGKRQSIFFLWRPCLPDPDDDMVLELAVAAGCDAIITHNERDFGPAGRFGIRVLTPSVFLEDIGGVS